MGGVLLRGAHACFAWVCVGGNGKCGDSLGTAWGLQGHLEPLTMGCIGALWGQGGLWMGGRGVKCGEPTRVLRGDCGGGRGSGVGLSGDVGTPRFGVQWGSMGCGEVI